MTTLVLTCKLYVNKYYSHGGTRIKIERQVTFHDYCIHASRDAVVICDEENVIMIPLDNVLCTYSDKKIGYVYQCDLPEEIERDKRILKIQSTGLQLL